ncbi:MAG: hypothetical protein V4582_14440 [Pseudomonadota bacterium]
MRISSLFGLTCCALALGFGGSAHATSLASSASSAGSASSGSISDSLSGSSDSSSGGRKTANGAYRIIDIAQTPGRADMARLTMDGAAAQPRIVLDLPKATFDQQHLDKGDLVFAQERAYGIAFERNDTHEAFYLVLADDWYGELAPRRVDM